MQLMNHVADAEAGSAVFRRCDVHSGFEEDLEARAGGACVTPRTDIFCVVYTSSASQPPLLDGVCGAARGARSAKR